MTLDVERSEPTIILNLDLNTCTQPVMERHFPPSTYSNRYVVLQS